MTVKHGNSGTTTRYKVWQVSGDAGVCMVGGCNESRPGLGLTTDITTSEPWF